jgi:diguanylate cyclase (GGDEF)-like protein/PAS domain S-box-containing protein
MLGRRWIGVAQGLTIERHVVRAALSRHPVAVECARAAEEITGEVADVVIFEEGRGFIVASSSPSVMQPRRLWASEAALSDEDHVAFDERSLSAAVVDASGAIVGAVTVHGSGNAPRLCGAVASLARLVSLAVAAETADVESNGNRATAMLDGLRDAVIVLDADLNIVWVNRASGSLVGRSPAEMIGRSAAAFIHPDDLATTLNALLRVKEGLETYRVNVRILRPDGTYESVDVTGVDQSDHPLIGGVVMSARSADIQGEMELSVERASRMADAIVNGLHDGIVAVDQFGAITMVNDITRSMFGLEQDTPPALFRLTEFRVIDGDGTPVDLELDPRLTFDTSFELGLRVDNSELDERHLTVNRQTILNSDGERLGSILVFHDVTAIKEAAASLRHQALHDQLTGLPNRRQLEERLADLESSDSSISVAACFIDLDGFKLINDNYGHGIGDEMIKIAAQRLEQVLRRSDLLIRQGGDEFVALQLGTTDAVEVLAVADRLRAALGHPFHIEGHRFDLTASVGVAITTSTGVDVDLLLRRADIALYAAKTRGRNRVELFDQALADAVEVEAAQQKFLRDALREERLVMYFQPLVQAHSEIITGYEALARIRTVDGEVVGPDSFLAAHLPADLMYALDTAAFDQSCAAAAELALIAPDAPPYVACNLSATTLSHPGLIDMIVNTAARHMVPPSRICLEVTESAAFSSGPIAFESLGVLHRGGFKIALDDFGTGYSSLVHLRDLPIDTVKVDRSFVSRLADHGSERAIVTAITALARNLGLGVVAEGVETVEDLTHAEAIGFDTMQGWYYSKAVPLGDVLAPGFHVADA